MKNNSNHRRVRCAYRSAPHGTHSVPYGLLLGLWLLGAVLAPIQAAELPKPYHRTSLAQIRQTYQGERFVLVLWSLLCSTCMKELDVLAKTLREHPGMHLVLISTDEMSDAGEVSAVLEMRGLEAADSWIFADDNVQRMRFVIDPGWYGELPRSYFYAADHQRVAVSGAIDQARLEAWLTTGKTGTD
ncbi:MAG: TlpA family protein disulfide reductase [Methylococcaceae bacterium]|nr:MAG: TlpA family protein disulfide reductase [Methylococcaceae bacterium]